MRVSVDWLSDYVDIPQSPEELAERLTMVGLNVESIERVGDDWSDVRVAKIVDLEPHPTSRNPLNVARVDLGDAEIVVVTGAPNVEKGDVVPLVPVGGMLPHGPDGAPMRIEARPMAGITSQGMLASARELGIADDHSGIYHLPSEARPGQPLAEVLGETVLDIETNPNRPDTLSVVGIAREVAAIFSTSLNHPNSAEGLDVDWLDEPSIDVAVLDPDLCPRYTALRIEGVTEAASPLKIARRLEAAGMRPINLVVDITNYVMLELGQPMHAFDARTLRGDKIVVRRAREGQMLRTLDGVDRRLTPQNLVIADAQRAVGIAGVMGGEESEISASTETLVLESATFDGINVRRTAQFLRLRTESSSRFEKGLPVEQAPLAAFRFLQLLAELMPAKLRAARLTDILAVQPAQKRVRMPLGDLRRLSGVDISKKEAVDSLSRLKFEAAAINDHVEASIPYWRRTDVTRSADLVEEVIRLHGYDQLPDALPSKTVSPPAPSSGLVTEHTLRRRLFGAGVSEATTHSLTSESAMGRLFAVLASAGNHDWKSLVPNPDDVEEQGAEFRPVSLINPPSQDRESLRMSILPSLLDVAARNRRETEERVALFEIDRTFFRRPQSLPLERRTLALVLTGRRQCRSWQNLSPAGYGFFDVKGLIEALLDDLRLFEREFLATSHPALQPGRSATLVVDNQRLALFGQLHPLVASAFELEEWPVLVAEMDVDALAALPRRPALFEEIARFPAANRDIAIVLDAQVEAQSVMDLVRDVGGDLLEDAQIFDVYMGPPLPAGSKSLAIGLTFRRLDKTLTQDEVSRAVSSIVQKLSREVGAKLRD